MSYIFFFLLIIGEYILAIPIARDPLQFHLIECVPGETSSTHILEITNFNETCVKINKSTLNGSEIYYHVFPETKDGVQLHLKTENCSTPIQDLHLTLCDNEDVDQNSTDIIQNLIFENNNSTMDTIASSIKIKQEEEESFEDDDN